MAIQTRYLVACVVWIGVGGSWLARPSLAAVSWPMVSTVESQPLAAATERLMQALEHVGSPLNADDRAAVESALKLENPAAVAEAVQKVLDKQCLVGVSISPESRVSLVEGPAKCELIQQGWRTFLVKVHNEAGVTAPLVPESPNLLPVYEQGSKNNRQKPMTDEKLVQLGDVPNRFLDLKMFDKQPLKPGLSGLDLEYRIVQLYSRDVGQREALIGFHVGQGTQDLGFRNQGFRWGSDDGLAYLSRWVWACLSEPRAAVGSRFFLS